MTHFHCTKKCPYSVRMRENTDQKNSVFKAVSNTFDGGFFPKLAVNYFPKNLHQRCLIDS